MRFVFNRVYNMGKPPPLPTMTPTSLGPNADTRRGSLRLITQLQPVNVMPFSTPVPKGTPFLLRAPHVADNTSVARAQTTTTTTTRYKSSRAHSVRVVLFLFLALNNSPAGAGGINKHTTRKCGIYLSIIATVRGGRRSGGHFTTK